MKRTVRGLVAFLIVTLMGGVITTGALAQPGDDEVAAMHEFRAQMVEEAAAVRERLSDYSTHIKGADWYVVRTLDSGPVAVELSRLPDYALAAEYFGLSRDEFGELANAVTTWDAPFTTAVAMLIETADKRGDVRSAATKLQSSLPQTEEEKRGIYQPTLRFLRKDRDALDAAITYFDRTMSKLGVEPAPVPLEPVVAEPTLRYDPEVAVLVEFRDDLVAAAAFMRERIADIRAQIDDPETAVYGTEYGYDQISNIDLRRLGAYESVAEYAAKHPKALKVLDVHHAQNWELPVALRVLTGFQTLPDDLAELVDVARKAEFQEPQDKKATYAELLPLLRRERDALERDIEIMDELILTVAPEAVTPTPTPSPPSTAPPAATPSPAPDPFADA